MRKSSTATQGKGPVRAIVSSSHLVSPRSAETSELEFGLINVWLTIWIHR